MCADQARRQFGRAGSVMVRVKSPQDLGAGAVFIAIGVAGIVFGNHLPMGTSARMGPGYFPMLLSGLIILVGLITGARGLTVAGPPIDRIHLRPLVFILGAIVASGYLLSWVGLLLTSLTVTLLAAYARRDAKLLETLLLGAGVGLFAILVFVYALNQPLPAWWGR
jgi:hypothetical protein